MYPLNKLYCNNGCAISFGTTRGALVPNFPARFQRHRKTGAKWLLIGLESVQLGKIAMQVGVYTLYYIILCTRFKLTTARRVNRDKFRGDGWCDVSLLLERGTNRLYCSGGGGAVVKLFYYVNRIRHIYCR